MYHIINRGVRRQRLFKTADEYLHFQWLMGRAASRVRMRLLAYCLMPNHWHLVVWPTTSESLSAYVHWLSSTHAAYYNHLNGVVGHVYQGRYRSIAVRDERHLRTLLVYVEGNPVRAGLVARAEHWRWSSLVSTEHVTIARPAFPRPDNWLDLLAELSGPGPIRDEAQS